MATWYAIVDAIAHSVIGLSFASIAAVLWWLRRPRADQSSALVPYLFAGGLATSVVFHAIAAVEAIATPTASPTCALLNLLRAVLFAIAAVLLPGHIRYESGRLITAEKEAAARLAEFHQARADRQMAISRALARQTQLYKQQVAMLSLPPAEIERLTEIIQSFRATEDT